MLGKQIKGMAEGTSFTDAVRKSQLELLFTDLTFVYVACSFFDNIYP